MKLQKIILCVAIATTAFGASLGLLEIGAYIRTVFEPALKVEVKPLSPIQPTVYYPQRISDFPSPAFTPTEESAPVEEEDPNFYGETGDYYIIGEKPKGFKTVEWLSIVDRAYSEKLDKLVPVKAYGSIRNEVEEFKFSWINITGKRVSLVTQTKNGVSYQFNGKFVEEEINLTDENGEEYTETVHLKGRLTKWRDGKKIAEAQVKLNVSHGC